MCVNSIQGGQVFVFDHSGDVGLGLIHSVYYQYRVEFRFSLSPFSHCVVCSSLFPDKVTRNKKILNTCPGSCSVDMLNHSVSNFMAWYFEAVETNKFMDFFSCGFIPINGILMIKQTNRHTEILNYHYYFWSGCGPPSKCVFQWIAVETHDRLLTPWLTRRFNCITCDPQ